MSEIKGQLLGIVLVLVIFGAISVTLATVFKSTASSISRKADDPAANAESVLAEEGNLLHYEG